MFWWLSTALLVVMMAALSAAEQIGVPSDLLIISQQQFSDVTIVSFGVVLILITVWLSYSYPSANNNWQSWFKQSLRFGAIAFIAAMLIALSLWQVVSHYQKLQDAAINQSFRVQAWVKIDGISDSVMDEANHSGYRQLAVIESMTPLTKSMNADDLNQVAKKALTSSTDLNADLNNDNQPLHRVLLQAYPKPEVSKNPLKPPKSSKSAKASKPVISAQSLNQLQPNDRVLMSLTIKPLDSDANNATGFDSKRWLKSRHVDGVAQINAVSDVVIRSEDSTASFSALERFRFWIDNGRYQLRQHFYQDWSSYTKDEQQSRAVTLSLLTGDRSLINRDTKDLYQLAGISHLLAISGTHVLFLALILASMVSKAVDKFWAGSYQRLPRWQLRFLVMVAAAFLYALFSGFDVPAARTAWTLLLVGLVRFTLLPITTLRVLIVLAIIFAWVDPFVLWQAGFWLSFIAVALLLAYEEKRETAIEPHLPLQKLTLAATNLFRLQCWLFLALLPVTLLLFGKVSIWGLVVNLFAIGLFGWVIVPLNLLAGVLFLLLPSIADKLWGVISTLVEILHHVIQGITGVSKEESAWLIVPTSPSLLLISALVLLPWLLPRGLIHRFWSAAPLLLLVMTVKANQSALTAAPVLMILPTNDAFISASLLYYPNPKAPISWLVLSDHRDLDKKSWSSALTAAQLSDNISAQLQSLGITRLDGLIVQSAASSFSNSKNLNQIEAPLLDNTAQLLSNRFSIHQYWQAGKANSENLQAKNLTAQSCQAGKSWQKAEQGLTISAMTGWPDINDDSVWDCTISIESQTPIEVRHFDIANPKDSPLAVGQNIALSSETSSLSRLILNTSRASKLWSLWSLICQDETLTAPKSTGIDPNTVWLGHSRGQISADHLATLEVNTVITYDSKPLEAALGQTLPP